ncbi:MAG: type II secretion system protein GspE, partial [Chlamydiota bacterium]
MARSLAEELPEILLRDGCVVPEQMEKALGEQRQSGERIDQILVKNGYVSEKVLMASIAAHLNIPPIDLGKFKPSPDVIELVSRQVATFYQAIPVARIGNTLTLAMVDPLNVLAIDDIKLIAGLEIQPAICSGKEFREALETYYSSKANMEHL